MLCDEKYDSTAAKGRLEKGAFLALTQELKSVPPMKLVSATAIYVLVPLPGCNPHLWGFWLGM